VLASVYWRVYDCHIIELAKLPLSRSMRSPLAEESSLRARSADVKAKQIRATPFATAFVAEGSSPMETHRISSDRCQHIIALVITPAKAWTRPWPMPLPPWSRHFQRGFIVSQASMRNVYPRLILEVRRTGRLESWNDSLGMLQRMSRDRAVPWLSCKKRSCPAEKAATL